MEASKGSVTLGIIVANRDFFPDKLVGECRLQNCRHFKGSLRELYGLGGVSSPIRRNSVRQPYGTCDK